MPGGTSKLLAGTTRDVGRKDTVATRSSQTDLAWIRFAFLIGKLRISGKIVSHPSAASVACQAFNSAALSSAATCLPRGAGD